MLISCSEKNFLQNNSYLLPFKKSEAFPNHFFLGVRRQSYYFFDLNHESSYWKSYSVKGLISTLIYFLSFIMKANIDFGILQHLLWSRASNRSAFFHFSLLFWWLMKSWLSFPFLIFRFSKTLLTWFINLNFFNLNCPKTSNEKGYSFSEEHSICRFLILSVFLMQADAFLGALFSNKLECASLRLI